MNEKKGADWQAKAANITGNVKAVLRRKFPDATQNEIAEAAEELAEMARDYHAAMSE